MSKASNTTSRAKGLYTGGNEMKRINGQWHVYGVVTEDLALACSVYWAIKEAQHYANFMAWLGEVCNVQK